MLDSFGHIKHAPQHSSSMATSNVDIPGSDSSPATHTTFPSSAANQQIYATQSEILLNNYQLESAALLSAVAAANNGSAPSASHHYGANSAIGHHSLADYIDYNNLELHNHHSGHQHSSQLHPYGDMGSLDSHFTTSVMGAQTRHGSVSCGSTSIAMDSSNGGGNSSTCCDPLSSLLYHTHSLPHPTISGLPVAGSGMNAFHGGSGIGLGRVVESGSMDFGLLNHQ